MGSVDALSTDHLKADLRQRSVRGGLLNVTSQGTQFLIQTVATMTLARLLTPADFGLVAMVSTVTGLGQAFADLGLSEATIQRKEISHEQVSALFWINLAIGIGLTLITAASAPILARFYRDPRIFKITLVVSLTFLLGGLRVQPDAILKRQMRYSLLAIRDITAYVVAVGVAITLALHGASYWALVALPLMLNAIIMVLSWLMVDWRPSLLHRAPDLRSLVFFGGNVASSYFALTVCRSADNILVGWRLGAGPLGFYSKAYNLLMLPVRQLSAPASSVAVPSFSRLQDDPERFARYYLRAANLLVWLSGPVFGFLLVTARPVIGLVLGRQWWPAVPVFQILVVSAFAQLLWDSTVWVFVSRGMASQLLKLTLIVTPIVIASFAIGLPFGIKGVAASGSLVLVLIFPWILRRTFRGTNLTLRRLAAALVCPIAFTLLGVLCSEVGLRILHPEHWIWELPISVLGFGIALSLSAVAPRMRGEMKTLLQLKGDLLGFRGSANPAA